MKLIVVYTLGTGCEKFADISGLKSAQIPVLLKSDKTREWDAYCRSEQGVSISHRKLFDLKLDCSHSVSLYWVA